MPDFSPLYAVRTQVLDVVDCIITERQTLYSPLGPSSDEQKKRLSAVVNEFENVVRSYGTAALFAPTIPERIYEIWLLGKLIMRDGDIECRTQISLQLDLMIEAVLDVR